MSDRLYRSQADRIIGGVCGGLGEYLRIDPIIIRLLFVLLAMGSGVGVMVYLVMWAVVPLEGHARADSADTVHENASEIAERTRGFASGLGRSLRNPDRSTGLLMGIGLLSLGLLFLADVLGLPVLRTFRLGIWWPVILIVLGVLVVLRRSRDG